MESNVTSNDNNEDDSQYIGVTIRNGTHLIEDMNNLTTTTITSDKNSIVLPSQIAFSLRRSCSLGGGTIPCTIEQAIERCCVNGTSLTTGSSVKKKDKNASSRSHQSPIDLLVIVLRVDTNISNESQTPYIRLCVTDTSIHPYTTRNNNKNHNNTCNNSSDQIGEKYDEEQYQILYFGKRRYDELINTLQIRPGDIIRCNRVTILPQSSRTRQYEGRTNTTTRRITFSNNVNEPEGNGPEYYKFGNVLLYGDEYGNNMNEFSVMCSNDDMPVVPPSMETNIQCLQNLVQYWFDCPYHYRQKLSMVSKNRHFGSTDESTYAHNQHYTLMEFVSSIGLIGHTTVYVVQIIEKPIPVELTRRKRKSTNTNPSTTELVKTKQLFVTLMDVMGDSSNHAYVTFIIDKSGSTSNQVTSMIDQQYDEIVSIFQHSQQQHIPIVLYNVQSSTKHRQNSTSPIIKQKRLNYSYASTDSEDVVLIATSTTTVRLVPDPSFFEEVPSTFESQPLLQSESYDDLSNDDDTKVETCTILSRIVDIRENSRINSVEGDDDTTGRYQLPTNDGEDELLKQKLNRLLSFLAQLMYGIDGNSDNSKIPLLCTTVMTNDDKIEQTSYVATIQLYNRANDATIDVAVNATTLLCLFGGSMKPTNEDKPTSILHQQRMLMILYTIVIDHIELRWTLQRTKRRNQSQVRRQASETTSLPEYFVLEVSIPEL